MYGMFYGCNNLTEIDLSSFNTKNVINMNDMLSGCKSSIKIKRKNFHKIQSNSDSRESKLFIIEV